VVGKIGGYRDAILHDLGQTSSGLMVEINNLPRGQSDSPADVTASEDAAKNPGSISGLVVDTDGDPAADVLIGLTPDPEMRSRSEVDEKVIYPAGMPRTVTDENGAFTISGLPPGIYIITGSLNSPHSPLYLAGVPRWIADDWRMDGSVSFVEVKAGAETKLPKPMELMGL
jgi:hypothetical protein